jgi:sulfur-oxidizing protein SoxY
MIRQRSTVPVPAAPGTTRRGLLLNARNACLLAVFMPTTLLPRAIAEDAAPATPAATGASATGPATAEDTIRRLARGATPAEGKFTIDLPEIAENGNVVPFTVAVDSPMTDADHVKAIHIISAGNIQPHIGSFNFTPLSGRAQMTSRMRLAKTQNIFILAEHSDGRFVLTQRTVKVTIGGCGGS